MKIYHSPEHSIEIIDRSGGRKFLDIGRIQTNDRQTNSGVIDEFIDALEQNPRALRQRLRCTGGHAGRVCRRHVLGGGESGGDSGE